MSSQAQVKDMKFRRIKSEIGLSQENVLTAVKDHQGFLWFGTVSGLNRYDGYQFRVFCNDPLDSTSISDDWIYCICTSRTGDLWIGTQNGGLNRYDHFTNKFCSYKNIPGDSLSLPDNGVVSVCEDKSGTLWIGTLKGYLCWMEPSGTAIHHFENEPNTVSDLKGNPINSIMEDSKGDLWMNSAKGLVQLNKKDKYSGKYTLHKIRWKYPQHRGSAFYPNKIYEDSQGIIYAGTTGGLYFYDRNVGDVRVFTIGSGKNTIDMYVSSIHEDRTGRLWIGTSDKGIYLIDKKRETYRHIRSNVNDVNTLGSDVIFAMCEDDAGTMWFGTFSGISCYDQRQKPFLNYLYEADNPRGLSNGNVMDIRQDSEGGLWLATHGGGLNYLPYGSQSFTHFRYVPTDPASLSTNMLLCMSGKSRDMLWIGSRDAGLMKFNKRTKKVERFLHNPNDPTSISDNTIFYLYEDQKDNLWIGTASRGVDKLDKATGKLIHYKGIAGDSTSLSGNVIWAILEDSKGYIWIGTQFSGLNCLDPNTGKCVRYVNKPGEPNSIKSNSIYSLHEYPEGVLWIGTVGGALNRLDINSNKFTAYMQKDGLPGDDIVFIVHDRQGRLWLGTSGITEFDPQTKKIKNYSQEDGIECGSISQEAALTGDDGRIYVGGSKGFFIFHPDSIRDNEYIPPIVFTNFKVFENSRDFPNDITQGIVLSYEENYFSFEFAALSYTAPEKNMYRYILEGYDKDWILCGTRRYASYTHVDPGNYVFKVIGSNEDGVWNTTGTSMIVHVVPPFWKTLWFRVSMVIIVLSMITFFIRRRFKFLEQRTSDQQELSRQLIESQENERKRIGIGLHDSLGQNLLVIKNLAVMGLETSIKNQPADEQLEEISNLASQALAEVREISYDLRPHHLDQLGLTGALKSIISRISASTQLTIQDDLDDVNNLLPKQEEINVFRIVQESVNNIIKHSRATRATITVKRNGDQVILTVSDNGIGLNYSKHGFGLTGMAERARILGGTLEVKSISGTGTTIRVIIPLKDKHAKS
jgi:signal transduction histidine kinase/ligand-binding sensor domain-containing protein